MASFLSQRYLFRLYYLVIFNYLLPSNVKLHEVLLVNRSSLVLRITWRFCSCWLLRITAASAKIFHQTLSRDTFIPVSPTQRKVEFVG